MTNPSSQVTVADVIANHARRDFGSSGFREVTLNVFNGDVLSLSYEIFHLWKVEGQSCSSVFFLGQPSVLAGTLVKVVENPLTKDMETWLRLRSATGPIRVSSSRTHQLLLGTDFTYEDLRFWLLTNALRISGLHFICTGEGGEYLLRARLGAKGTAASEIRFTVDATRWLVLRMEWHEADSEDPQRIYSATDLVCVDGIWTPLVISVCRPREQYKSVMTLRRVLHRVPIESGLFRTENLASLSKSTFEIWTNRAHEFSHLSD